MIKKYTKFGFIIVFFLKDFLHAKSPLEKYNDDKELKKERDFMTF